MRLKKCVEEMMSPEKENEKREWYTKPSQKQKQKVLEINILFF